jgi:hypothetical protein
MQLFDVVEETGSKDKTPDPVENPDWTRFRVFDYHQRRGYSMARIRELQNNRDKVTWGIKRGS